MSCWQRASKGTVLKVLSKYNTDLRPLWSITRERNGYSDYGYTETYIYNGEPVTKVEISFYPPKVIGYINIGR